LEGKDLKGLKGFEDIYVRLDWTAFEREEFAKSLKTAWELKQKGKEAWVNYQGMVKVRDGNMIKTWADVAADQNGAPTLAGASV
jgi:hypothetical protein